MTIAQTIAGIDVAKEAVDIAICDHTEKMEVFTSKTDPASLAAMVRKLKKRAVDLVVLEATGGLETPIMEALAAADIRCARVNPRAVRDFAKAMGILAKTDRLDAKVLALYGVRIRPAVSELPSENERRLNALAVRKRQLIELRQRERNRTHRTSEPTAAASLERLITTICVEIETIDAAIDDLIAQMPEIDTRRELADSVVGIAQNTATTIVTGLPELGRLSTKKLKKLVGVAPLNDDSATRQGGRHIAGGRGHVRQALYMAAQTGYRHNPALKVLYDRLRAKGKAHKEAIIACVGKLISILNAIFKTAKPFDPNFATR
jgi:transposase